MRRTKKSLLKGFVPLALKQLTRLYIKRVTPSKTEIKKTMILFTIVVLALLVFVITNWGEIMG